MEPSCGDPKFPIWLVADSPPKEWHEQLLAPLDPRHPARHNIWTPILEYTQEALYRKKKRRFDTARLYIRNAVTNPDNKPDARSCDWIEVPQVKVEMDKLQTEIEYFKPKIVLTFGAFAFEFLRRTEGKEPLRRFSYWGTKLLGDEFRKSIKSYDPSGVNIIPLLHVSIARGKFLESHRYFVGEAGEEPVNYFEYVGKMLADLFLQKLDQHPIWMK